MQQSPAQTVTHFSVISTQTVHSRSWAVCLNTFAFIYALLFCFFFFFLHDVFWWKPLFVQQFKIREPKSISFNLALAFPSSWNCDWAHVSEAESVGRPAATPQSLPFLRNCKIPSKESVQKKTQMCMLSKKSIGKGRSYKGNQRSAETETLHWPFGQLGQSPWSFGGWGLVSGECRPPGRKHGPQTGPCFLCERGREHRVTFLRYHKLSVPN